jgi:hypothetical protein
MEMDVVYLVKGYLTPKSKEKEVLYNGQSPRKAFDFFDTYSKQAELVVEVYEEGYLVKSFTQNEYF